MGVRVTRYSPSAKIPTLAATERARRALRGETELASKPRWGIDQVESSAVSAIEKGHPNGCPFSMVEVTRFELATSTSRT